jgi:hypothetical protein
MSRQIVAIAGAALLLIGLGASPAPAADEPAFPAGSEAFAQTPKPQPRELRDVVETIDRLIAERWQAAHVEPAAPASDAEYLRRVYLDLTGTIPPAAEVRAFLDDPSPDKRRELVERLLASPGYINRMTDVWKGLLLPEANGNQQQLMYFVGDFEGWLRSKFIAGSGYDVIARELLTTPVAGVGNRFFDPRARETTPTAFAYYAAKEGKPENLAAGTARVFLGLRIECAQCHDHPFAKWKREQFWGLAALFASIQRQGQGDAFFQARELPERREITITGTTKTVSAKLLDGEVPQFKWRTAPRHTLAEWMTSHENPYFARAAVNRVWGLFFGIGLVDPIDDMEATNPPSHPELLDELARQFVAHDHDLKFLIRVITASRAYGLSSAGYSPGQDDPRLFARMPVRGLTAQQLYESYVQATGIRREKDLPPFFFGSSPRKDFLERFAEQEDHPGEQQRSILQALTLMNGRFAADAASLERGGTLPAVASAYFLDTPAKIEALFLATLGRRPTADELDRLVPYVDRGGPALQPRKALSDVFWALINSAEFTHNH